MQIRTKAEFYALWTAGVLGNKLRTWTNADEAYQEGLSRYALREQGVAGGGAHDFVERKHFWPLFETWYALGRKFFIAEPAEDAYQTLQGEICRTTRGWEGLLGSTKLPMRAAMAAGLLIPQRGLTLRLMMQHYIDPSSMDDIDMLLDRYPDAALEFTAFSKNVGLIPRRNCVIWEVRCYEWLFCILVNTTFLLSLMRMT